MPKETMTPRERWLAVLNRQKPDRVPMDYWATAEANKKLMEHLAVGTMAEVFEKLHIDAPFGVNGKYVGPKPPEGRDVWGWEYKTVNYGSGAYNEMISPPLAGYNTIEEIEANYSWPKNDWWDYSDLPNLAEQAGDRVIRGGGSEPFLKYCVMRGMEQAFMDLVLNKELAHYILDKLFDWAYEDTRRIYEALPGRVDISYVAEDLGSQEDLMFSPAQIEEFLLPRMKRMMDLAHSAGVKVFTHSDGAVRKIIPGLIGIGMDVLNPIQWRCRGMEREGLKRDFGDQIIFHGAVDNQQTLPFGTVEEVRQEVIDNLRILGAGGGYILAPCHNIQVVSPPENVVAMYETGYEHGWA